MKNVLFLEVESVQAELALDSIGIVELLTPCRTDLQCHAADARDRNRGPHDGCADRAPGASLRRSCHRGWCGGGGRWASKSNRLRSITLRRSRRSTPASPHKSTNSRIASVAPPIPGCRNRSCPHGYRPSRARFCARSTSWRSKATRSAAATRSNSRSLAIAVRSIRWRVGTSRSRKEPSKRSTPRSG